MAKRDILTAAEIENELAIKALVPGEPYQFILGFGWVLVGFYIKHETPLLIRLAHCNYYRNGKKPHSEIATDGAARDAEWRYFGQRVVNINHVLDFGPYNGEVPRGKLATGS